MESNIVKMKDMDKDIGESRLKQNSHITVKSFPSHECLIVFFSIAVLKLVLA